MKKILLALSVALLLLVATGASADIRSDKCDTYSNDLGISSALDNYSGDTCVWSGSINYYTNKDKNAYLVAKYGHKGKMSTSKKSSGPTKRKGR